MSTSETTELPEAQRQFAEFVGRELAKVWEQEQAEKAAAKKSADTYSRDFDEAIQKLNDVRTWLVDKTPSTRLEIFAMLSLGWCTHCGEFDSNNTCRCNQLTDKEAK